MKKNLIANVACMITSGHGQFLVKISTCLFNSHFVQTTAQELARSKKAASTNHNSSYKEGEAYGISGVYSELEQGDLEQGDLEQGGLEQEDLEQGGPGAGGPGAGGTGAGGPGAGGPGARRPGAGGGLEQGDVKQGDLEQGEAWSRGM